MAGYTALVSLWGQDHRSSCQILVLISFNPQSNSMRHALQMRRPAVTPKPLPGSHCQDGRTSRHPLKIAWHCMVLLLTSVLSEVNWRIPNSPISVRNMFQDPLVDA